MDYTALKSTGFAKKFSFLQTDLLSNGIGIPCSIPYVCHLCMHSIQSHTKLQKRGLLKRVLNIIYLLLYYKLQFLFYNFVIHWLLHLFRGSHPAATMTCGNLCANLSCLVIKHNRKDGAICFATGFRILLPFYEAVLVVYGQISQRIAP